MGKVLAMLGVHISISVEREGAWQNRTPEKWISGVPQNPKCLYNGIHK